MEKRMFQILDEMNQEDTANKTRMVEVGIDFISGDKVKGGAKIAMGMPESALFDIISETKIPLLILVDKKEYFKRKDAVLEGEKI